MSYDISKRQGYRHYVEIFEMDLDINDPEFDLIFAAELNSRGTPKTTKDSRAWKKGSIRTYRYTNLELPTDDVYFPNLDTISDMTSAKLRPGVDVALSASADVIIRDFPENDTYQLQGPYIKHRTNHNTHFKLLMARNHIANRPARIKRGYMPLDGSDIKEEDFQIEHYIIKTITPPDRSGKCKITLRDRLYFASDAKAKIPAQANALVKTEILETGLADIAFVAETFGNMGYKNEPPIVGHTHVLLIGDELFETHVLTYDGDTKEGTLKVLSRGALGSKLGSHDAGDKIQGCVYYKDAHVLDIIKHLLKTFTNIGHEHIPDAKWDVIKATEFKNLKLTQLIVKPVNIRQHLRELVQVTGMWLGFDTIANELTAGILTRYDAPVKTFSKDAEIITDTLIMSPQPNMQCTRAAILYGKRDATKTNRNNFIVGFRSQDDIAEDHHRYGQVYEQAEVKSNWHTSTVQSTVLAQRVVQLRVARFTDIPHLIKFKTDARNIGVQEDGEIVWNGAVIGIASEDQGLCTIDGDPVVTYAQIVSLKSSWELDAWEVEALSYSGETINPTIGASYTIEHDVFNINLCDLIGDTSEAKEYVVIIATGVVVGSTSTSTHAITTGTPTNAGASILLVNLGFVAGMGGKGGRNGYATFDVSGNGTQEYLREPTIGQPGGPAIKMMCKLTIDNLQGLIGGGGAGGTGGSYWQHTAQSFGGSGGGGAGSKPGEHGEFMLQESVRNIFEYNGGVWGVWGRYEGKEGSLSFGGVGGVTGWGTGASKGGKLGEDMYGYTRNEGEHTVLAGHAIERNGNILEITTGNNERQILGKVI